MASSRGHIVKRSRTSWTVVIPLGRDPVSGRRKQRWVSIKGTKKDAQQRLTDLLHEVDTGQLVQPVKETLGSFLDRWLTNYVRANLAPSTADGYEFVVSRYLIPALGSLKLTELKPHHIQAYAAAKLRDGGLDGKPLGAKTVRGHLVTLHDALGPKHGAIKWKLLTHNPVDGVDKPRIQRKDMRTFDEAGFWRFLDEAKAREPEYYALFYFLLFTGARRGEALAVRWNDVDLVMGQASITRAVYHTRAGAMVYRQPKTAKGRRLISLPPSLVQVLSTHQAQQEAEATLLGRRLSGDTLVFSQPDGSPLLPNSVSHAWIKLVRQTGFSGIRLHDARHSHATRLLQMGVHPKIVQERLGHAQIGTTLDVYSHIIPSMQQAAAERFDAPLVPTPAVPAGAVTPN